MSTNVFRELSDALMARDSTHALWDLVSTGFFKENVPDVQVMVYFKNSHSKDLWNHTLQVVMHVPRKLELKFAALFHDIAKPETYSYENGQVHFFGHETLGAKRWYEFAYRNGVDRTFADNVANLILEHLTLGVLPDNVRDSVLKKLINKMGDQLDDLFALSLADITSTNINKTEKKKDVCFRLKERVRILIEEEKNPTPRLPKGLGLILMKELNIPAGPALGSVMKKLEEKLIKRDLTLESDFIKEAKEIINGG